VGRRSSSPVPGRVLAAGTGAVLVVLLSGCSSASQPDVTRVVTAFEDPAGDPRARCDLLAPATRTTFEADASASCNAAIGHVPLAGGGVRSVEIWGGGAQVRLSGDTLFLTQTGTGWRVTAAGCRSHGEAPYDCAVKGP
jgi:hypothetical protein